MLPRTRSRQPARPRLRSAGLVAALLLAATATVSAQESAADFELDGRGYRVVQGESAGQWQIVGPDGATVRALDVPPRWTLDGAAWRAEVYPLDDGSQLTALTATVADTAPVGFVLHGRGEPGGDEVVWSGVLDAMYGNLVVPREIGGRTELVQIAPDARVPPCGELTEPLALARFDPATGTFTRPVAAPRRGEALEAAALDTPLDGARLSAPLNVQTLTQPAALRSNGAVMTGSRALFDGDPTTSDALEPGRDLVVLQLDASLEPHSLILVPADEAAAAALAAGAITVQTEPDVVHPVTADGGAGELQVPLAERCVIIRADKNVRLAEVALLSDLDEQPLDEAIARTVELALTLDDPARVRELARVLSAHTETALPSLIAAAEATTDAARLARLMLIAERLDDRAAARLALAIAVHPATDEALLTEATTILRRFPKVAATALEERAATLTPGTDEHLAVASLLATLPVSGTLAPLLRELDRSRDDANRADRVLDALTAVGPRLTQVVPPYLVRDDLSDETRVAMLRAMLRVAPAWHAHFEPEGPTAEAIAWLDPLTAMLARDTVAVQLLGIKNARAYRLGSSVDALATLATQAGSDVVRAEAIAALAELAPERTAPALTALTDEAPTARIAAAEALSVAPTSSEITEALRRRIDEETWPEARGPALLGLARAAHPDTVTLATGWLTDSSAPLQLRQSAAEAIAMVPTTTPWPTVSVWLGDETLDRTSRRVLLADYLRRADADIEPVLSRARELAEPRPASDKGDDGWRRDFVETTIVALQTRGGVDVAALLVDLSERAGDAEDEVHVTIVEAMGYHDSPAVRARLAALAGGPAGRLATAAATSVRRLDGEPIFDMSEPVDDLPEF